MKFSKIAPIVLIIAGFASAAPLNARREEALSVRSERDTPVKRQDTEDSEFEDTRPPQRQEDKPAKKKEKSTFEKILDGFGDLGTEELFKKPATNPDAEDEERRRSIVGRQVRPPYSVRGTLIKRQDEEDSEFEDARPPPREEDRPAEKEEKSRFEKLLDGFGDLGTEEFFRKPNQDPEDRESEERRRSIIGRQVRPPVKRQTDEEATSGQTNKPKKEDKTTEPTEKPKEKSRFQKLIDGFVDMGKFFGGANDNKDLEKER